MIQLYLDGHPSDVLIHLDGFPISLPFSAAGDTLTFTWDSRGANDSANIMEICAWSDGGRLGISPSRMILVANWT